MLPTSIVNFSALRAVVVKPPLPLEYLPERERGTKRERRGGREEVEREGEQAGERGKEG